MNWRGELCEPGVAELAPSSFRLAKYRIERVLREDVLDVRDEQFLMLLFVMDAKDENRLDFIEQTFVGI